MLKIINIRILKLSFFYKKMIIINFFFKLYFTSVFHGIKRKDWFFQKDLIFDCNSQILNHHLGFSKLFLIEFINSTFIYLTHPYSNPYLNYL